MIAVVFDINWIFVICFILVATICLVQWWQYKKLKNIVFIGYDDAITVLTVLANINKLESNPEKFARLLRLNKKDMPHEMKRDQMIQEAIIVSSKVVSDLQIAVPESKQKIKSIIDVIEEKE